MTPEQCIQRLARRLNPMADWRDGQSLLNSIDALRPVLATMTNVEKAKFCELIIQMDGPSPLSTHYEHWLLTIDPQQLAFAIAEALGEEK